MQSCLCRESSASKPGLKRAWQLRGDFNRVTGESTNRRRNSGGIQMLKWSWLADAYACGALPQAYPRRSEDLLGN